MGRVRTKTVKRSSKAIIEHYYPRLSTDFETNKRICDEVAIIASKRLRNKIAGYTTRLMRRIARGPVRGISFKLQEEERERRDQFVPEVSALDYTAFQSGTIEVDRQTMDLVNLLGFNKIPVDIIEVEAFTPNFKFDHDGKFKQNRAHRPKARRFSEMTSFANW